MSRINAWKPKPKFTAGLNVPQEEWDRIFGKKKPKEVADKLEETFHPWTKILTKRKSDRKSSS